MIVCHCMNITDQDIHAAVDWMRASDEYSLITPGRVYHALGKSADCGGCMPLFLDTMRQNDNLEVPMHLRGLKARDTQETRPCKAIQKSSSTSTSLSATS